jgi:uncharacterized protein (TIGR03437 family)
MSNQPSSAAGFAPGSLFYMNIQRPSIVPTGSADTDPGSLTFSLVGYSFKVNGILVPLRSYTNGTFLAQMPVDLKPGVFALQAFNASGLVGTGQVTISAIVPRYLEGFANGLRARKANGSIVDASNPVRPGEPILVRLTGQGAVKPPLASGSAASIETASVSVGMLTAYFGTKAAKIESAKMSAFEAGVLDVWVTVPNLYAGDHFLSINIGPVSAGNLPIKVTSSRGRIPALGGFKTLP